MNSNKRYRLRKRELGLCYKCSKGKICTERSINNCESCLNKTRDYKRNKIKKWKLT